MMTKDSLDQRLAKYLEIMLFLLVLITDHIYNKQTSTDINITLKIYLHVIIFTSSLLFLD